ncbi:MAG: hypothetical protein ACRDD1_14875 [Planctomycetia bacterium]
MRSEMMMMSTYVPPAGGTSFYTSWDRSEFASFGALGVDGRGDWEKPSQGWSAVFDELLRIRKLPDDWDGEGTASPNPSLVDGAISLAQRLRSIGCPPPNRVLASVDATVYFEWHSPIDYCEIEVVSPVDAEYRRVRDGSNETEVVYLPCQS